MGTVCKYFLTNSCRYGDRCRFSHVYSSPYVYDVRQKGEGRSVMQRIPSQASTSQNKDEIERLMPEYVKKIMDDVNQIELQHMWPLTCYSFMKSQGNFAGWNDISMEEVRWEAYQAQANGTTQLYLSKMQELLNYAKELRSVFVRPSKQTEAIIRDYMKGNNSSIASTQQSDVFSMSQPTKTQSNFSFAAALEQTQSSQPSEFSQLPNSNSSSMFSQPTSFLNQPSTQPSTFFGAKSSFEPAKQSTTNLFQSASTQGFSSNVEARSANIFSSVSPFQQTVPSSNQNFMASPSKSHQSDTRSDGNQRLYSTVDSLSKEDYEAFKATTFTLENIPFVPPPRDLC